MDQVQSRIQDAITSMVNGLDADVLRKMQHKTYKCCASCCEQPDYRMEDVQSCVDKCNDPINRGQQLIQDELTNYQNRLQRCAMDCQDKLRDRMNPNSSESEMTRHRHELEGCVLKCADEHIKMVPQMKKRLKDTLKNLDR